MKRSCSVCGRPACELHKTRTRDPRWSTVRREVLERDGHRCVACGEPCPHPERCHTVDHIAPFRMRPDLELVMDNCRTLCGPCDRKLGA